MNFSEDWTENGSDEWLEEAQKEFNAMYGKTKSTYNKEYYKNLRQGNPEWCNKCFQRRVNKGYKSCMFCTNSPRRKRRNAYAIDHMG